MYHCFASPVAFMRVAGQWFDTVALAQTGSRRSNRPATEPDLRNFVVRQHRSCSPGARQFTVTFAVALFV
jgi:hypothetical protein